MPCPHRKQNTQTRCFFEKTFSPTKFSFRRTNISFGKTKHGVHIEYKTQTQIPIVYSFEFCFFYIKFMFSQK